VDEDVVEPRLDLLPDESRAVRFDRMFQRLPIEAGDAERAAEHRRRLDARRMAQRHRGAVDALAGPLKRDQAGLLDHRRGAALHDDAPLREIDDALAALRLVHIVGRDKRRQPVDRHVVNEVPELAPRLGVDARGRLVEQQELRLMQHAGGEREALLPSARQLPGQLAAPVLKPHALQDRPNRIAAVPQFVDPRDEVEVLEHRQIVVEAKSLRHVADLAANIVRLVDDVVAEALTRPAIRLQKAAEHANRRRLAAAVGAEKPANLAPGDLQAQTLDDLQLAETLAQSPHVDGVVAHWALLMGFTVTG